MLHLLAHERAVLRSVGVGVQLLAPAGQVSPQPVEGLPAQAGSLLVIEVTRIFALAAASQGRGTGGVVAVVLSRHTWLGAEGLAIQAGTRGVKSLVLLAQLSQRQTLAGIRGLNFPLKNFRQLGVEFDQRVHRQYVTGLIARNNDAGGQASDSKPWTKLPSDRRITPVGKFLRKTCIDEIPQLVNVLKGDLSLVGPRPPLPYEAAVYESWHLRRVLDITPGITGLWQVQGGNGTFDDMVRMDLQYMRSWSLMLDLKILIKTVVLVLRKNGGG